MKIIAYQHRQFIHVLRCLLHQPESPAAASDYVPLQASDLATNLVTRNTCSWPDCGKHVLVVAREVSKTPCGPDDTVCQNGERCDTHETELAHAEGNHDYCGLTCETEFPSDMIRNTILFRAIPGSKNMLAELERRAQESSPQMAQVAALTAEVTRLRAELGIGDPWTCHVCGKENHRAVCLICETDRPDPAKETDRA